MVEIAKKDDITIHHTGFVSIKEPYYTLFKNKELLYTTRELGALIRYLTEFDNITCLKLIRDISVWYSPITFM